MVYKEFRLVSLSTGIVGLAEYSTSLYDHEARLRDQSRIHDLDHVVWRCLLSLIKCASVEIYKPTSLRESIWPQQQEYKRYTNLDAVL